MKNSKYSYRKFLIYVGIIIFICFSLVGCQSNELAKYKDAAKNNLETYVENKGQDSYTTDNWNFIMTLLDEYKSLVNSASNQSSVDAEVMRARKAFDEVPKKMKQTDMDELELRIRQDYLYSLIADGETGLTLNDVQILKNYGVFGECAVVRMNRGAYLVITRLIIDEITFTFENSNTPLVWKHGQFYELEEAYNQKLLSRQNLLLIADIQSKLL